MKIDAQPDNTKYDTNSIPLKMKHVNRQTDITYGNHKQ